MNNPLLIEAMLLPEPVKLWLIDHTLFEAESAYEALTQYLAQMKDDDGLPAECVTQAIEVLREAINQNGGFTAPIALDEQVIPTLGVPMELFNSANDKGEMND